MGNSNHDLVSNLAEPTVLGAVCRHVDATLLGLPLLTNLGLELTDGSLVNLFACSLEFMTQLRALTLAQVGPSAGTDPTPPSAATGSAPPPSVASAMPCCSWDSSTPWTCPSRATRSAIDPGTVRTRRPLSPGLQALCYGLMRHTTLSQLSLDASQCQLSPFASTILRRAAHLSPGCLRSLTLNLSGNSFMADASLSLLGGLVSAQTGPYPTLIGPVCPREGADVPRAVRVQHSHGQPGGPPDIPLPGACV